MTKEEFTKLGIHIGYLGQKVQVACMGSKDITQLSQLLPKDVVEDLCKSVNELRLEVFDDHVIIREQVPIWDASTIYNEGDKVLYEGIIFTFRNGKFVSVDGTDLDELRISRFSRKLVEEQKDLNPEDQKLLNDHLWELT